MLRLWAVSMRHLVPVLALVLCCIADLSWKAGFGAEQLGPEGLKEAEAGAVELVQNEVTFPPEPYSPVAAVDYATDDKVRELKKKLIRLGRDAERRGGLTNDYQKRQHANELRDGHDDVICAFPGLGDLFGGVLCTGVKDNHKTGVEHRPMMAARPSKAERKMIREEEEGERLRKASEAVDAAEDKMGDYYGNNWNKALTQPKDLIVPAVGGQSQHNAWKKIKDIIDWLFSGHWPFHWNKEWFHHNGGDAVCGDNGDWSDPTCGSDLTLHKPHKIEVDDIKPFISPFAGKAIKAQNGPLGDPVPCLNPPTCSSAPQVGAKKEYHQRHFHWTSFVAGKPIKPTNSKGGKPVPCLEPFCGATATLHKPIKKVKDHPHFVPFTAGVPITRGSHGLGAPVRCVGPGCNSAPFLHPPNKLPKDEGPKFFSPFRGVPIRRKGGGIGEAVPWEDHSHPYLRPPKTYPHERPWFRSPVAGQPIGSRRHHTGGRNQNEGDLPGFGKGGYNFPGGGWHGGKWKPPHGKYDTGSGRIGWLQDDQIGRGDIRPWMFRQVYPHGLPKRIRNGLASVRARHKFVPHTEIISAAL